jgi:hypothetical membrane protein
VKGNGGVASVWAGAAVVGVVAYVLIDVALVFLRPHFSVLHNAESDYGSKGRYAWLMDLNFVLRCLLSLAVVRALTLVGGPPRLRMALGLLAAWAVCSGLLAFFPDDPVGTRTHGLAEIHLALAALAFVAVVLGTCVATRVLRTQPPWRPVAGLLALLAWGAVVPVLLLGHAHLRAHTLGGLYEKVFLAVELGWLLVVAVWIARGRAERVASEPLAVHAGA